MLLLKSTNKNRSHILRVHGDKVLRRRDGVGKLNNYNDKPELFMKP